VSTAIDLLETAEDTASQNVHDFLYGDASKPDPDTWLQMLAETQGILLRVSQYYLRYDGLETVTVHSKGYTDVHSHESAYIQSLLDYYEPEPVYEMKAPNWVRADE
jgi:hypothetical protein